ncbi:hypothetical protein DMUE_5205, partial [Dictyocoela muelleri]
LPIFKSFIKSKYPPFRFKINNSFQENKILENNFLEKKYPHQKYLETKIYRNSPIPFEYSFSYENPLLSYSNLEKLEIKGAKYFDFELLCNTKINTLVLIEIDDIKNSDSSNNLKKLTLKNLKSDILLKILKYQKIESINISRIFNNINKTGNYYERELLKHPKESFVNELFNLIVENKNLKSLKFKNFNFNKTILPNLENFYRLREFFMIEEKFEIKISYFNKTLALSNINFNDFFDTLKINYYDIFSFNLYECEINLDKIIDELDKSNYSNTNTKTNLNNKYDRNLNNDEKILNKNYSPNDHFYNPNFCKNKGNKINNHLKIKELTLSNCVLNKKSFENFLEKIEKLEYIDISHTSNIDFLTIEFIARKFNNSLKYFDFSGIEIWGDFLIKIKKLLPNCKVVYSQGKNYKLKKIF